MFLNVTQQQSMTLNLTVLSHIKYSISEIKIPKQQLFTFISREDIGFKRLREKFKVIKLGKEPGPPAS